MAAGNVLGAVTAGTWFTRGTWKRSVVDEGEEDDPEEERSATTGGG